MFLFQGRTIAITNSPSPTLTMGGEPIVVTIAEEVQSVKLNKAAVPAASIFITMNTFTEKMRQVRLFVPRCSSQIPVESCFDKSDTYFLHPNIQLRNFNFKICSFSFLLDVINCVGLFKGKKTKIVFVCLWQNICNFQTCNLAN